MNALWGTKVHITFVPRGAGERGQRPGSEFELFASARPVSSIARSRAARAHALLQVHLGRQSGVQKSCGCRALWHASGIIKS